MGCGWFFGQCGTVSERLIQADLQSASHGILMVIRLSTGVTLSGDQSVAGEIRLACFLHYQANNLG